MGHRSVCALLTAAIVVSNLFGVSAWSQERRRGRDEERTPIEGVKIGKIAAEVRTTYSAKNGFPADDVYAVTVAADGAVYAGTSKGVAKFGDGKWTIVHATETPVRLIAVRDANLICTTDTEVIQLSLADKNQPPVATVPVSPSTALVDQHTLAAGRRTFIGSGSGLFEKTNSSLEPVKALEALLGSEKDVRQVAEGPNGEVAVAALAGLFVATPAGEWSRELPRDGEKSWAPYDVRGVTFDRTGRLWFASPQGVGVKKGDQWTLLTGYEGLPFNEFTTMAAGETDVVWFGTTRGAIRYDGKDWEYRMAPRWLPDNVVRSIAVEENGTAWFATEKGIGSIERKPMTLAEKAKFFEDEIDKYHRRTPYGFVHSVRMNNVDDKSETSQSDSDNDGLWTGMYGAGECFAYGATKDPKAKQRATAAFEALRFLSQVTQGGSNPAPPGFPARSILPTSGHNPNPKPEDEQREQFRQFRDPLWKTVNPRWPTSADGQWYWKCDTSSDELDGHYFLYARYYDLVAETDKEKQRVRDVVKGITDHLMAHDYSLVDHDGKPTRWARFGPQDLNSRAFSNERGLNSLSMLSFLKITEHVTGEKKYGDAYRDLIEKHNYAANVLFPKMQAGPATGNQSDDEMAFMNYYSLLAYETDPDLKRIYVSSLYSYWRNERPELSPLFNYIFAAGYDSSAVFGLRFPQSCLDESADTLVRYPLDRVRWAFRNSHRTDVVVLPGISFRGGLRGHRRNGKVIPIDERSIEFWNHDPWQLGENEDGKTLTDGAAFLLPYYMGLYHKFIVE